MNKMRRNCVLPPTADEDEVDASSGIATHVWRVIYYTAYLDLIRAMQLVKTLIEQSHLAPLPLHVRPIYWDYDAVSRSMM